MIDGGGFYVSLAYSAAYLALLAYGLHLSSRLKRLRADAHSQKDLQQ